MSDQKISALTGASTPLAGTEVLPIVQSGSTVKVSVANLTAGRAVSALTLASTTGATFATTSGNVGINSSTPTALLQLGSEAESLPATYTGDIKLNGPLRTSLEGTGGIEFIVAGSGYCAKIQAISDNGAMISFGTRHGSATWTERMRIAGDTGTIRMNAYGAGAATFSASGVISSVSDENWKRKDGVPSNPTEMLCKLQPGYWYYNDEKKNTFGVDRQLGFYAQNVHAAIGPEAAPEPESFKVTDEQGVETLQQKPWGYYDRSVLAVVVMALQEALATVKALEVRIQALEGKI